MSPHLHVIQLGDSWISFDSTGAIVGDEVASGDEASFAGVRHALSEAAVVD